MEMKNIQSDSTAKTRSATVGTLWYVLCVALMPFALLSYQYLRNIAYIALWQIVVFCVVTALVFVGMFYLLRIPSRTDFGAFLGTASVFIAFFMYRSLIAATNALQEANPFIFNLVSRSLNIAMILTLSYLLIRVVQKHGLFDRIVARFREPTMSASRIVVVGVFILIAAVLELFYQLWVRSHPIYAGVPMIINVVIVLTVISILLARNYREQLSSVRIPQFVMILIGVLLIQNVAGIASFFITQGGNTPEAMLRDRNVFVDESITDQPNIYWFHCDGMLGLDATEAFFGDDQEGFVTDLEDRGFWINPNAAFEAYHSTQYAIPILMNPTFFDQYLAWRFDSAYALSLDPDKASEYGSLTIEDISLATFRKARENNELVFAFNESDYYTSIICMLDQFYFPTVNRFYNTLDNQTPLMIPMGTTQQTTTIVTQTGYAQNLVDLLNMISPIPPTTNPRVRALYRTILNRRFENDEIARIADLFSEYPPDPSRAQNFKSWDLIADALYDARDMPSPHFMIIVTIMSHRPFFYDEQGNYEAEHADDPWRYPAHQAFGVKVLMTYIDMLLESDPNAVIVLQSDHGLHGFHLYEIMETFGCTEGEALALWNQTFSAVRMPQDQLTEDTKIILSDPRNISRFLVNTFVGQNYEYIPPEFRQTFEGPNP